MVTNDARAVEADIYSDLSSLEELSPYKKLEAKVEDAKMFFTMCCAVCYVFSMTVVCFYYSKNNLAFTG